MTEPEILREGTPCRAVAMAVATVGFLGFGAITLVVLLVPETINTGHYILGGIIAVPALVMYPWQILDTKTRRHILTSRSVIYRCGILTRFEVEVPYRNIQAIVVRQGILQRVFGCGDVRISAHAISGPVTLSQQDMNSVCIRSIKDFAEVGDLLRRKMNEEGSPDRAAQGAPPRAQT